MSPLEQYQPPKNDSLSPQQEIFIALKDTTLGLALSATAMGAGIGGIVYSILDPPSDYSYSPLSLFIGLSSCFGYKTYSLLKRSSKINRAISNCLPSSEELSDLLKNNKNKEDG